MLDYLPAARATFKADMMKDGQETVLNSDRQIKEGRSLYRPEKLPNGKYRYQCLYSPSSDLTRTPSGATTPARISLSAAIYGAGHLVLSHANFDLSTITKL